MKTTATINRPHTKGVKVKAQNTALLPSNLLVLGTWGQAPPKEFTKGLFGRVRTKAYRGYWLGKYPTEMFRTIRYDTLPTCSVGFGTASIPYQNVRYGSVRYPTEMLDRVRYGLDTLPKCSVWFGTIPYRNVRQGSVRPRYPTDQSCEVWYELDTGNRHFGNFNTPTKNTPGMGIPYRKYPWNLPFFPVELSDTTCYSRKLFTHSVYETKRTAIAHAVQWLINHCSYSRVRVSYVRFITQ